MSSISFDEFLLVQRLISLMTRITTHDKATQLRNTTVTPICNLNRIEKRANLSVQRAPLIRATSMY